MTLEWPLAETPTHMITMAFDPDLDDCVVIALRDMIKLICRRTNLSREQAYTLCSLAADLRVTQVVNGNKGIHVMLDEEVSGGAVARPIGASTVRYRRRSHRFIAKFDCSPACYRTRKLR